VLFLSLIFCKQEEKLLFFGSISGCTCLILIPLNPVGCVVVAAVPNPPKPTIQVNNN
jgi:hypothetical protein